MKPHSPRCAARIRACAVSLVGLMATAVPAAASAATAAPTGGAPSLSSSAPTFGRPLTVGFDASGQAAGMAARLELQAPGEAWQALRATTVGAEGHAAFRVVLPRSGDLRVVVGDQPADGQAVAAAAQVSPTLAVSLQPRVEVATRHLDVLTGQPATVSGSVAPAQAGRSVTLERRTGRTWRALATTRTGAHGAYRLRYRTSGTGDDLVRLSVAGDETTGRAIRSLGRLTAYRATTASRYDAYGGPLACGGRLGYDSLVVAHKTLPCGTAVTVRYHGRVVHARVADRGPYVGGREFDLAGAVARRLGFDGVGTVWVTA